MSKCIILYASHKCESEDSQPIKVGKTVIWIRVQEVEDHNDIYLSKTIGDEVVLNTYKPFLRNE